MNFDGFVKSPSAALPPCDARRQALHPCPVKCSLREAKEANVRVSGSELPISENSLFNGVNHCGVQEVRLILSDLRALHLRLFTVPSDFQLFTASSHDIVGIKLLGINDV